MELPDRIANKIEHSSNGCWTWTGYVIPKKTRRIYRTESTALRRRGPYKPTETGDYPFYCDAISPPSPRVSYKGKSQPAKRVVASLVHGIPLDELPPLRSICSNPLCVNPAHTNFVPNTPVTLQELINDGQVAGVSFEYLKSEYPNRTLTLRTYAELQNHS